MEPLLQKILVVGGNGFVGTPSYFLHLQIDHDHVTLRIGSAVCKAALARGFQVTSIRYVSCPPRRVVPVPQSPPCLQLVRQALRDAERPFPSMDIQSVASLPVCCASAVLTSVHVLLFHR